jgi:transcriptional regulator, lytR family
MPTSQVPLQPGQRPRQSKKKKKKTARKIARICLLVLPCVLVLCILGVLGYGVWLNSQLKRTVIDQDNSALGIEDWYDDAKYDDVTNIALFGIDTRQGESSRSDAVMVLTVDRKRNKMKATSLLRDSLVTIQGRADKEKLAHAYAYGGPQLAIRTINENFGLNIRDYVTVDFDSMAKIVDAVGGVVIDVKENELESTNRSIQEYCSYYDVEPTYVNTPGEQLLNGMQACGYSRVRYDGVGDDRQRTDRQRRVIEQVFNKVKKMNPLEYPGLANKIVPLLETSMSTSQILGLGTSVLMSGAAEFEQARFPMNVDLEPGNYNGASVILFDAETTKQKLHDFLFEDIQPE